MLYIQGCRNTVATRHRAIANLIWRVKLKNHWPVWRVEILTYNLKFTSDNAQNLQPNEGGLFFFSFEPIKRTKKCRLLLLETRL